MHRTRTLLILAALVPGVATAPAWGQVIHEDVKLLPRDGTYTMEFGWSIAIDNGVVAVAAWHDRDNGNISGSAYLFEASTGNQLAKLLPTDGAEWDQFGSAIAIDNGVVAVGAWGDDDNGESSGSAYLFDASTGAQLAKLLPSDGGYGDLFGRSIDINNGVVAVGAYHDGDNGYVSGSAYLFDASTGVQLAKLLPTDGAAEDWFGWSIAIDNGIIAVGAVKDDDNGDRSGSVYLFDASTGAQIAKLLPIDGGAGRSFGHSVAISDGLVVIGERWGDDIGEGMGSAYLFDASTGAQIATLLPSDGMEGSGYGHSVAIDNGIVAVGARFDSDIGFRAGSAFLFDATTGTQIAKLLPSDLAPEDWFGNSVAISNGIVAAGALLDDDSGPESGSAYVFTSPAPVCPADLTGDGLVNTQDFIAFLNAWATGDPIADWNDDGTINTQDFIAYLNDWAAGC